MMPPFSFWCHSDLGNFFATWLSFHTIIQQERMKYRGGSFWHERWKELGKHLFQFLPSDVIWEHDLDGRSYFTVAHDRQNASIIVVKDFAGRFWIQSPTADHMVEQLQKKLVVSTFPEDWEIVNWLEARYRVAMRDRPHRAAEMEASAFLEKQLPVSLWFGGFSPTEKNQALFCVQVAQQWHSVSVTLSPSGQYKYLFDDTGLLDLVKEEASEILTSFLSKKFFCGKISHKEIICPIT